MTVTYDEIVGEIVEAIHRLTSDVANAAEIAGSIQDVSILDRICAARDLGEVVLDSKSIAHPLYPNARIRSPLLIDVSANAGPLMLEDYVGPICFLTATDSITHGLALVSKTALEQGALSLSVYSCKREVLVTAQRIAEKYGMVLSANTIKVFDVEHAVAACEDAHILRQDLVSNDGSAGRAFVANRFSVDNSKAFHKDVTIRENNGL